MDVLCIGLAGYDLVFPLPEFPREDTKYQTDAMQASGGGPAGNAACLLSRWGRSCGLACVLGDDAWGDRVRAEFAAAGTDLRFSEKRRGHTTPLSCIWVNRQNGSRTIVNHRQAGDPLRLEPSALASSRLRPRLLLADGHEPEAALAAMAAWPRALTVLDAGSLRRGTEMLAPRVDYLVASAQFARAAAGVGGLESREEQELCLRRLAELNPGHLVVTLGQRGLIYRAGGELRRLPAHPVRAVDSTAAGDVFHGAFADGLMRGLPLEAALRLAAVAAALSVTRPGGRDSIPAREEVEAALRKGEP
jgi:sulfofructose kinase